MSSTDLLDDLIRSALNDPLPDEAAPVWQNVLRRVPAPKPRRRRVRRLVLAFAILAVVLVPPAVAFHRDLADWILGEPAPEHVANAFRSWNLLAEDARTRELGERLFAGRLSQVVVSKAQGVVALDTPDGTVSLWDVPQRRGGRCWLFVVGEVGTSRRSVGSCDFVGAPRDILSSAEWIGLANLPDVLIVHVRVHGPISVELRFADGRTQPMEVVAGHALAAIPKHSDSADLVAKDAEGKVVKEQPLHLPPPNLRACPGICSGGAGTGGSFHVSTFAFGKG
jgi:hypothetical protein